MFNIFESLGDFFQALIFSFKFLGVTVWKYFRLQ